MSWKRILLGTLVLGAVLAVALAGLLYTEAGRRLLVGLYDEGYAAPVAPHDLSPRFKGPDLERDQVPVTLVVVAEGFKAPVDMQFVPGQPGHAVVLSQRGQARWLDLAARTHTPWISLTVATSSEQGLLGLAFHPGFAQNGRFFLNYVVKHERAGLTIVEEWKTDPAAPSGPPSAVRRILEVRQPYQNHNGGQLQFGPDGMLYVGLGDGGFRDDPEGHGQNTQTLLGSMLRLNVDAGERVPPDNPFVGTPGVRPEIWAYGLRNPWRYSFAPDGRLIAGDVGQDKWEEITEVPRGANLGWALREGQACFPPQAECPEAKTHPPLYTYARDDGGSVTGGLVYTGTALPALAGLYVFGDFLTGRLWAIPLPAAGEGPVTAPKALGRFPVRPSAFARDSSGELYVLDYSGRVLALRP
jgi:glucose/arabinose dehydrogenase